MTPWEWEQAGVEELWGLALVRPSVEITNLCLLEWVVEAEVVLLG